VQQFKRLVGKFRKLAATPPNYSTGTERTTLAEKALADIQREALQNREPEKIPEPESFGSGLRRIRNENRVSAAVLGEIVGTVGGAISNWESDRNAPCGENLEKLYAALPELKAAVDVGAVKPPVMKRPGAAGKLATTPTLVVVKSEPIEEPIEEPANTNADARAREPEQLELEPETLSKASTTLADAAVRFAEARVAMQLAKQRHEAAVAALHAAERAWREAEHAHDEALQALDGIASGARP
jgi:transcriptional regulator with XRE-family HTH domain